MSKYSVEIRKDKLKYLIYIIYHEFSILIVSIIVLK